MRRFLIGIDEAGRGPLAGPVAVGAVAVPADFDWRLVLGAKDSKQMTPKSREAIYETMCALRTQGKLDFTVMFSSAALIDTRGIVPAVRFALNRALAKITKDRPLWLSPDFTKVGPWETTKPSYCQILLDGGLRAPDMFDDQKTIIRGDQSEPVISLASIAAKVLRDRLMVRLSKRYPAYGFEIHKGYGTIVHRRRIKAKGLSPEHRKTFCH